MRLFAVIVASAFLATANVGAQSPAHPFQEPLPAAALAKASPALRAANLSPAQCRAELSRRRLAVKRAGRAAPGVATPVRLAGAIGGVRFVAPGARSPYGILDCRLVLALEALAAVLAKHDVVEARIDNLYRPRARLPGRRLPSQHSYGLAVDLMSLTLKDGRELSVEEDFGGSLGDPPCGPESQVIPASEKAVALRNIVCAVAREGIFHYLLTPNYNEAHRDHLHLDIKRGLKQWAIE